MLVKTAPIGAAAAVVALSSAVDSVSLPISTIHEAVRYVPAAVVVAVVVWLFLRSIQKMNEGWIDAQKQISASFQAMQSESIQSLREVSRETKAAIDEHTRAVGKMERAVDRLSLVVERSEK